MLMTGGQAVVETLDAWGVDVVFGIPGFTRSRFTMRFTIIRGFGM